MTEPARIGRGRLGPPRPVGNKPHTDGGTSNTRHRYRGEIGREEPVQAFESFQLHLATLLEVDSRAGDKVVHHVEHQDFVAEGMAGDARRIVWTPIRTRIGGELSANALPISRWIACAHATPRRALENASIDPRLCLDDRAAVLRGGSSMMALCLPRTSTWGCGNDQCTRTTLRSGRLSYFADPRS